MSAAKLLTYLGLIAIVDAIIPIPFTTLLLIYVVLECPPWFRRWVDDIYSAKDRLQ